MCLFSIIIPCYNIEEDLPNAIESVMAQVNKNYEVILVNDGSTDGTYEVMQRYEGEKNFKLVNVLTNKGLSATRNTALKYTKGDFVLFLDGDDTYHPDLLKDIEAFLLEYSDLDIISFGYGRFNDHKLIKRFSHPGLNRKVMDSDVFLTLFLKRKMKQHICAIALKLAVIHDHNLLFNENTPVGEDQEFQIKANFHARKIGYLSNVYFKYNVRDTSLMGVPFNKKRLSTLHVFERLYAYLTEQRASNAILKNLINYSSIEYFSVLNKCIKQGSYQFIKDIQKNDRVVYLRGAFGFDKFSIIAFGLKNAYRLSSRLFFSILKIKSGLFHLPSR